MRVWDPQLVAVITPVACISSAFYEDISQKASISPTQSVVYHQVAEKYTLKRDDMLAIGEMICRLRRMIYQVCDLDKKITASKKPLFFGGDKWARTTDPLHVKQVL